MAQRSYALAEQLPLGLAERDAALDQLAAARADWITWALAYAKQLIQRKGYVTADSLRLTWPVPDGVDARVVGAVLCERNFKRLGSTQTTRRESHYRPIGRWGRKDA